MHGRVTAGSVPGVKTRTRIIGLFAALLTALGLAAGTALAGPPVKVESCELHVTVPTTGKTVVVPICNNGPPIQ